MLVNFGNKIIHALMEKKNRPAIVFVFLIHNHFSLVGLIESAYALIRIFDGLIGTASNSLDLSVKAMSLFINRLESKIKNISKINAL